MKRKFILIYEAYLSNSDNVFYIKLTCKNRDNDELTNTEDGCLNLFENSSLESQVKSVELENKVLKKEYEINDDISHNVKIVLKQHVKD